MLATLLFGGKAQGDGVELKSGTKIEGEIVNRDEQSITLKRVVGGRTYTRKIPVEQVRAVVRGGEREALDAKGRSGSKAPSARAGEGFASPRTKAEVQAYVDEQGRTPPDWWDSTPLDYPKTLDLSFPQPGPKGWDNQRNVGQYLWDIVNPNPGKWKQGIRFMHHLLTVNKDQPETRFRVMNELGRMYFVFLQDYARAAFWFEKAGVPKGRFWTGVHLAECYWRLGNKQMALSFLDEIDLQFSTIKLLADMGETGKALRVAQTATRGPGADLGYLYAGDACRVAQQHAKALQFYEKVLTIPAEGQAKGRIERSHNRARANIEALKLYELLDLAKVPDGAYRSVSPGYAGQIRVAVSVKAGRIEDVKVIEHQEKQFYSALTDTPRKIIAKQAVTGIDTTSQATMTSEAIVNATAKALAGAMKP